MHVWFTNRIKNSNMIRYRRGTENMYKIGTKKSHDHVWYPTMIKIKTLGKLKEIPQILYWI